MASKTVTLNNATYTELDTSTASALDCQNVSNVLVRVRYKSTAPALGDGGYKLNPGQGLKRDGHTNSMWGICEGEEACDVEVGE